VKVLLKLVCYTCGVTILGTRYLFSPHCVAFPVYIAAKCSWSFVYCVITLCASLFTHVYCFTMCVALLHTLVAGCWLEVSIRKVLRPATSAQVLLGFPVSISEC